MAARPLPGIWCGKRVVLTGHACFSKATRPWQQVLEPFYEASE